LEADPIYGAMAGTPFIKMHGLGNDFVVLDARARPIALDDARARAIADRHTGVGCDQLLVMEPPCNPVPTSSCASATPTATRSRPAATARAASPRH
jgi:diaminopimelate epimerase